MKEVRNNFYVEESEQIETPVQPTHEPFVPANDMILVKRVEEDNSKKGSFVVPEKWRQKSNRGSVISFGHKVTMVMKRSDIITFGVYNAETILVNGEELLLIRENDVRGIERAL